ncbi:MAG: hypothetical protein DSY37_00545 [Hyperthermus sp.]|nr:MAG: hypothetical protein DSY37_00545 [Hyperthermus sp.]
MFPGFVDRDREYRVLEEAYRSGEPELIVVYGPWRAGKTFLVKRFLRGKRERAFYMVANFGEEELVLLDLKMQGHRIVNIAFDMSTFYKSLRYMSYAMRERFILVIDGFQILERRVLKQLVEYWDKEAEKYKPFIILVGEGEKAIERLIAGDMLQDRVTRVIKISAFGYRESRVFMNGMSPEDKVTAYGVFGGIPYYLSLIDPTISLLDNVRELVLKPGAPLREEPLNYIYRLTREPGRYMAALSAIARGCDTPSKVAACANIRQDSVARYLRWMEENLDLVYRIYPLSMDNRLHFPRYRIANPFFKWWFAHILPLRGLMDLDVREAQRWVEAGLEDTSIDACREVALEHLHLLRSLGRIEYTRIGWWWWSMRSEAMVVAVDEANETAIFVECEWGKADESTLQKLVNKSSRFPWRRRSRENIFVIYALDVSNIRGGNVIAYTLEEVDKDFNNVRPSIERFEA